MLHARIASARLGDFDVYFDTRAPEQIIVGQIMTANDESYYDLWMSFRMRSLRGEAAAVLAFTDPPDQPGPATFGVATTTLTLPLTPLEFSAEAALEGVVRQGGSRIVIFELSRYLQLKSVEMDGKPLEFIQNEAIPGSQLASRGNDLVAVVFPQPLTRSAKLQVKFNYAGSVLSDAGDGLFYVGARGTWYPNRGIAMANYDITFRFPAPFTFVASGKQPGFSRTAPFIGHWISDGASRSQVSISDAISRRPRMPAMSTSIPMRPQASKINVRTEKVFRRRLCLRPSLLRDNISPEAVSVPVPVAPGVSVAKRAAPALRRSKTFWTFSVQLLSR